MTSRPAAVLTACVAAVIALYTLYVLRHALLMVYVAVLLAILFEPAVRLVRGASVAGHHPGRGAATALVSAAVAGIIVAIGLLVVPAMTSESGRLSGQWGAESARLLDWVHRHVPFTGSLTTADLQGWWHSLSGEAPVMTMGSRVMDVLVTLLIGIYVLAQGPQAFDWALSFVPERERSWVRDSLTRAAHRTQRWVHGQAILMLTHGVSAILTFWAIGLPYFLTLGVFAAVINVIPVLGPILTLGAAGLVALVEAPGKLLAVVIFYLAYHNFEGIYLQPRVMESAVGVPGVAVVIALVLGDALAGLVGMAFAVPTTVLISEIAGEFRDRRSGADR